MCLAAIGLLFAQISLAQAATYFGATISGEPYGQTGNAPRNQAAWDLFERHAGKKVAIVNQGQSWAAFDKEEMDATNARGAIPLVTMGLGSGVTLAEVAAGGQDAAIKKWAQEAKAWGHPFFFGPWWEMNGAWYPWGRSPDFVAAWRHFHDVVVTAGATNVTWTWITNAIWSDPESDPTQYYPGDAYVDWVGIDSYNWGLGPAQPDQWRNPDQTITPTLEVVKKLAAGKPVAIIEDASSEYGGNKADWIREMLTAYLPRHPEIGAYLWFNWNLAKNGIRADWPIESSATAQQAFRKAVQSSFYVGAPFSLPSLTKVPRPPTKAADAAQAADLSGAAEMASGADVAVAPDGTATVVWSARSSGTGMTFAVLARRIAPDGTPIVGTQQLSTGVGDALAPRVAVAPDGTATVVWTRYGDSDSIVEARRITPSGALDAAPIQLSKAGVKTAAPQVAVAPDGTATIVWKRFGGYRYVIDERRIDPEGGMVPESAANVLSVSGQESVEPVVAAAADGTATVVWSRYDGSDFVVQERRVAVDGTIEATTNDLSASGEGAIEPQIALAPDGTASVVWTRYDSSSWVVQGRRLSATGDPAASAVSLSAAGRSAVEPQIAVGPDGSATVVWDRFDGADFIVQSRRLDPDGAPATTLSLSASGRDAADPQVAVSPAGTATILWSRFDGSAFVVQRRDLAAAGALTGPENLSAAGRSAGDPALDWGSDGTLVAVWKRFNGAGDVVQRKAVARPDVPEPPPDPDPSSSAGSPTGRSTGGTATIDNSFQIGRALLNRKQGTAKLPVVVPGAGRVTLAGAAVRRREVETSGKVTLTVVPRGAAKRTLGHSGVVRIRMTITFVPSGGTPNSRTVSLKLKMQT